MPILASQKWVEGRTLNWYYDEMTDNLSYILGVLLGDGYIVGNSYRIGLHVIDFLFADAFYRALHEIQLNPAIKKEGKYYRTAASSKKFSKWFNELSFDEIESIIEDHEAPFIRGLYDSEGNLSIRNRKDRDSPDVRVRCVNTNKQLLLLMQRALLKLGIYARVGWHYRKRDRLMNGKIVHEKDCFVLDIHGCGRVIKFLSIVGSNIKRKKLIFLQEKLKEYSFKRKPNIRKG